MVSNAPNPRSSIIRDLTRGSGCTAEKLSALTSEEFALFHARNASELQSYILAALGSGSKSIHLLALERSLNMSGAFEGNLAQRRMVYSVEMNVSERTIIRREASGVDELLAQIDHYATVLRPLAKDELGLTSASNDTEVIIALRAEILRLRTIIDSSIAMLASVK